MLNSPKWTLLVFHCKRDAPADGVKTIQKPDLADEDACKKLGECIRESLKADYEKEGVLRPHVRYTYFKQT